MKSVLDRYIFLEILKSLLAIGFFFLLFYLGNRLVGLLADVAAGNLPVGLLFLMLMTKTAGNLVLLLPAMFFIAILLALGRMYQDNEISVMAACGVGRGRIVKAILLIAIPFSLLTGMFSLQWSPQLKAVEKEVESKAERTAELSGIRAGRFKESGDGKVIFYAAELLDDWKGLKDVFVRSTEADASALVVAQSGYMDQDQYGNRNLVLENGYRYEGDAGTANYRITRFEQYSTRVEERKFRSEYQGIAGKQTSVLLGSEDSAYRAEFQWRLALPISALILAVIALPLSHTSPRKGRYGRLFAAVLVYVVYANLMTIARSWMEREVTPGWLGIWWVHVLILGFGIALWWKQNRIKVNRSAASAPSSI